MSTALYRHFDDEGALLYVGISLSWPARTKQHASGSRWFDQVAKVEIERFPTREAALDAEREAIKREKPQFNIIHNRDNKPARPRVDWKARVRDPLLKLVAGPDAIVGPALMYRGDTISVVVAHGAFGEPGVLDEIILGEWFGEIPDYGSLCESVITVRRANEITMGEAVEARLHVLQRLKAGLRTVEAYESDIALAVANASRFPSPKSRQILDQVAAEKGVAA